MIRLLTGNPGAGKTLRCVEYMVNAVREGRPVFACNVNGLSPDVGATVIENPNLWQDLPDGSLVIVDEIQDFWKQGSPGQTPDYIERLSTHRHRGFDFILMTQHPTMVHSWVRKLVGEHEHLVRQFGVQASKVVRWLEAQDDPKSQAQRERGTSELWRFPKELYPLYKSATLHTVKTRIPLRLKIIPALLVLLGLAIWFGYSSFSGLASVDVIESASETSGVAMSPSSSSAVPVAGGSRRSEKYIDAADYAEQHTPRIAAKPWTAPIFDSRSPVAEPELYCIASETLRCICHTEQGTKYHIDSRQCLAIVHGGGTYNPYRKPFAREHAQGNSAVPVERQVARLGDEERPAISSRDVRKRPAQSFPAIDAQSLTR